MPPLNGWQVLTLAVLIARMGPKAVLNAVRRVSSAGACRFDSTFHIPSNVYTQRRLTLSTEAPAPAATYSDPALSEGNRMLLFWACFASLIATSFGFIIRAMLIDTWGTQF